MTFRYHLHRHCHMGSCVVLPAHLYKSDAVTGAVVGRGSPGWRKFTNRKDWRAEMASIAPEWDTRIPQVHLALTRIYGWLHNWDSFEESSVQELGSGPHGVNIPEHASFSLAHEVWGKEPDCCFPHLPATLASDGEVTDFVQFWENTSRALCWVRKRCCLTLWCLRLAYKVRKE